MIKALFYEKLISSQVPLSDATDQDSHERLDNCLILLTKAGTPIGNEEEEEEEEELDGK